MMGLIHPLKNITHHSEMGFAIKAWLKKWDYYSTIKALYLALLGMENPTHQMNLESADESGFPSSNLHKIKPPIFIIKKILIFISIFQKKYLLNHSQKRSYDFILHSYPTAADSCSILHAQQFVRPGYHRRPNLHLGIGCPVGLFHLSRRSGEDLPQNPHALQHALP